MTVALLLERTRLAAARKRCIVAGYPTKAGTKVKSLSYPFTGSITISFKKGDTTVESLTASISSAADASAVADAIVAAAAAAGYTTSPNPSFKTTTWDRGAARHITSGSAQYVMLSSKAKGDFTISLSGDDILQLFSPSAGQAYYSGHGTDIQWEEIPNTTGLIALVANIAERLTVLESQARYIGQKTLTAAELEEAGLNNEQGSGSGTAPMG